MPGAATRRPFIGCGSASLGDRLSPAFALADSGEIDYLVFDRVGEMSMAAFEARRTADPAQGYDRSLADVVRGLARFLGSGGVAIGSFAGANPAAATRCAIDAARALGLHGIAVAALYGDNVLAQVRDANVELDRLGCRFADVADRVTSAYAYIGADGIVDALRDDARIVIGGRLADSSMATAALVDASGLALDDWPALAVGTMAGHLLEGGSGITGGGFADPPFRPAVPGYAPLGFPLARIDGDTIHLTKLADAAGTVTPATVASRILYETQDPASYLTPDVHVDFTDVTAEEIGPDLVAVSGVRGLPAPPTLRVIVTVRVGWKAVTEVSYGGPGCLTRAQLAEEILRQRLADTGVETGKLRFDYHGISALFGAGVARDEPDEVRLRVAALCDDRRHARAVCEEAALLYFDRPAGMGATQSSVTEAQVGVATSLPRGSVRVEHEVVVT